MSTHQIDRRIEEVDKAMLLLRKTMKGIQIRTAGFKADHDQLARSVAMATALISDARALAGPAKRRRPK